MLFVYLQYCQAVKLLELCRVSRWLRFIAERTMDHERARYKYSIDYLGIYQLFILQIEVQEGTFMGYMGYNAWGKWAIRTISCNIPQHSPTNNTLRATFPATDRRPPATVNCSTLLSGRTLPPSTRFWFGCRPPSYCLLTRVPGPIHVL